MTTEVALFRKVKDAPFDGPNELREVDSSEKLFSKPTLVCCGGVFINSHLPDYKNDVNGFIKVGLALLGAPEHTDASTPFDVVGIAYPKGDKFLTMNLTNYGKAILQQKATAPTEFAQSFAQKQLFPLVEDEHGKARDLATIKRNLRNVHFLGSSYGSVFIQQTGDALAEKLHELGVSDKDIKDATSQVVAVTAGATLPPATGKASFTTLSLLNLHDTEVDGLFKTHDAVLNMLARAPEDLTLLVDAHNNPVHRSQGRTHQERLKHPREYPAQSFSVVPVKQNHDGSGKPNLTPDSRSNYFLASITPPTLVNGAGDIAASNEPLHPYGTVDKPRGNPADATEFQGRDVHWHSPKTYYNYNRERDKPDVHPNSMLSRTMASSVLVNGMNNAIKNAEHPEKFEPLPPMKKLARLPVFARYDIQPDVDFRSFASDNYNEAITQALTSPGQLAVRGR